MRWPSPTKLQFPGQIFDGRTGLHQNGFRDYDAASASHVENTPVTGAEFQRNTHRISARTIGWCVTVGMSLVACKPADAPPPSGQIGLAYAGLSGSDAVFRLDNGSSQTIRFRGLRTIRAGADPWDTHIECEAPNGATMYEHPIALVVDKPSRIEVSPGEQMRLVIGIQTSGEDKGAHCRLHLKLEDGSIVTSNDFAPQ